MFSVTGGRTEHTHTHTLEICKKNIQPHSFLNSWRDAEALLARQLPFPMHMGWYIAFCGYSLAVFWRRAALFCGMTYLPYLIQTAIVGF